MLDRGGNALDAAVAVSLALGVCEPAGSGLGGMTMMLVHHAASGRTFTIEGPCRAPRRAEPEVVAKSNRYRGHAAVAVPTNVATVDYALRKYGTLSPAEVLRPAIQLAEEGFPLTALQCNLAQQYRKALRKHSGGDFFLDNGDPHKPGTWLRQPALAETLRRLAANGFADFYTGEIAQRICQDHEQNGGFIRQEDLADVPWPTEREPLCGRFGDAIVNTLPPPGGGMALVEMLQIFSALDHGEFHPDTGLGPVLLAAIIRKVRRDRQTYRLKTACDGVGEAAVLVDEQYAQTVARQLPDDLSAPGETSHVSIIDRDGNAVAMTQSLERSFGSAAVCPQLGFLYNGYLRAFKVQNRRHPHYLKPAAPARSNAAPTILVRDGKPWAVIGSTGSERMTSGIFQVLVRLGYQSPFEAVYAPRLHCTPESLIRLEAERFAPEVLDQFTARGFTSETLGPYSFSVGGLQLAVWQDGVKYGVAEPRRDGAAIASRPLQSELST